MQIINIDWCTVSLYILCGESRELFIHCGAVILSFVRVCRVLNVKDFDFDVCTEVCMINEVDRRKHVYKTIELYFHNSYQWQHDLKTIEFNS